MLTKREILRKTIHLSSILIIFLDSFIGQEIIIYFLLSVTLIYTISEFLRVKNKFHTPLISDLTEYCSTNSEKKDYVYAPLFLATSILILLIFFDNPHTYLGIVSLGLGDAVASLIGKKYGKKKIFYNKKKTLEGSFSMFLVVFLGSFLIIQHVFTSLIIGLFVTFIESLSNESIDNLTIPFSLIVLITFIEKFL